MPIVYACTAAHAPGITAWSEAAKSDQLSNVHAAFERIRADLVASRPDRILLLTSEHWTNFFLDHVGPFCFGRAVSYEGPVEPWLKIEKRQIPGDADLSLRLLQHCYANGFEPNHAQEMKFDHGTMVPLSFLVPEMDIPVVPILFNTLCSPRARPGRCYELGALLRPVLNAGPERIAVVATGGMSHDPGEVGHGIIHEDFDKKFMEQMRNANGEALKSYSDADLMAAGAGTIELLSWICLAGMLGDRRPTFTAYEPVRAWATGLGFASYVNFG
ncbi:hypothetical protein [Bradyrhizobium sp. RDM4]|uniref:DODA-type extradiol aromatic ring-opening family dioxygenase n=1 Tax=Bradyrhizobium sp. RDM4 TaxID=3378765 RepID=UPI0038FCCA6F